MAHGFPQNIRAAWWILIPSLLLQNKKESRALSRKRQVHLGNSIILRTSSYCTTLIWASCLLATIYFSATAAVAGIYTTVCCNKVPNQIMTLRPIIIVYQDQEDKSRRKIGLYFFHCREETIENVPSSMRSSFQSLHG